MKKKIKIQIPADKLRPKERTLIKQKPKTEPNRKKYKRNKKVEVDENL